jgi:nitrate reductase beta subunit
MTAFDAIADKFHLTARPADTNGAAAPVEKAHRINLLNWDGKSTDGLFPAAPANGVEHVPDRTR